MNENCILTMEYPMHNTIFDIMNEFETFDLSFTQIAAKYNISYSDVLEIYTEYMEMLLDAG